MSDPIEPRLSSYFAELRPNPEAPAEARLIAALDDAAAGNASGSRLSRLWPSGGRGREGWALTGLAAVAIVAIVASLSLRGANPGGAGGPGPSGSPHASDVALISPSAAVHESPSATPTSSPTVAAKPGTFTPTGNMSTLDAGMATLLQDGRVLIVGNAATSPELYDPKTGKFSKTGPAVRDYNFGSATLLVDGRVLFAGGSDGTNSNAFAQIYDPATGKFSSTGSMAAARMTHTATLLPDGRVLVAGGWNFPVAYVPRVVAAAYLPGNGLGNTQPPAATGPSMLSSAEIYDPKTGEFTSAGSMTTGRSDAAASLLPDGRVLIAGGGNEGRAALTSAELYDPKTGKFTRTGSMVGVRYAFNMTSLQDGRVLVSAGNDGNGSVYSLEIYNPKTGKFTSVAAVTRRGFYTVALLQNGRVLVIGGFDEKAGKDGYLATCQLFDPATGKFTTTGSMSVPRLVNSSTTLQDGRVLVAGGVNAGADNLSSAELYQP